MLRITKKFNGEYYHKDANTIMFNNEINYNAIQKLGKLEDIMEKYNIDSVEELDNVLSMKYVIGGMRSGKKTLIKGILYNKISEQLDCPLEVIFKATQNGIIDHKGRAHEVLYGGKYLFAVKDDELQCPFYLKNYQKTWWLKGEKNDT